MLSPTLCLRKDSHLVAYESGENKTALDMILIKREHTPLGQNICILFYFQAFCKFLSL